MSEIPGVPKDGSAVDPNPTTVTPDPRVEAERQRALRALGIEPRPTSARDIAAPPPDWHNLSFWALLVGLGLNSIITGNVLDPGGHAAKWVLVLYGFVNGVQYAFSRGKIRGTR